MGHLNIVKSLLQRGASPNASNVVRTVYVFIASDILNNRIPKARLFCFTNWLMSLAAIMAVVTVFFSELNICDCIKMCHCRKWRPLCIWLPERGTVRWLSSCYRTMRRWMPKRRYANHTSCFIFIYLLLFLKSHVSSISLFPFTG